MSKRRSFNQEFVHEDHIIDVDNLLQATIYNFGTEPIKVFSVTLGPKVANQAPEAYNISSSDIPFENDFKIPIKVTGTNATENNVYITYTSLIDISC